MSPATRIFIRYLAGYLVLKSILPEDIGNMIANDPDLGELVELGIGATAAAAVEGWYMLARRFGWAK